MQSDLTFYTSIIALGLAALAALYTRWQFDQTKRSANAAERSAASSERAERIAERSARAAEQSAEASKTIVETGQRAWVVVSKMNYLPAGNPINSPNPSLQIEFKNTGATPALGVKMRGTLELRNSDPPDSPLVLLDDTGVPETGIGNGQPVQLYLEANIGQPGVASIRQRTHTVFAYGWATYKDVFGRTHETQFSFKFEPDAQQYTPHGMNTNT